MFLLCDGTLFGFKHLIIELLMMLSRPSPFLLHFNHHHLFPSQFCSYFVVSIRFSISIFSVSNELRIVLIVCHYPSFWEVCLFLESHGANFSVISGLLVILWLYFWQVWLLLAFCIHGKRKHLKLVVLDYQCMQIVLQRIFFCQYNNFSSDAEMVFFGISLFCHVVCSNT